MTWQLPILLGLIAGAMTYLGGVLAMVLSRHRPAIFGLTAGLLIGLALLDLLPEAIRLADAGTAGLVVPIALAGGFAGYHLLHRLPAGAVAGRIAVLLHSFADGLGIGLAFHISASIGWGMATAVLAHKLADGANMVGITLIAGGKRKAHRWLVANAIAPMLGVICAGRISIDAAPFAPVLALFAGGFLYIAFAELLPRSRIALARSGGALAGLAGVAIMAGIAHLSH